MRTQLWSVTARHFKCRWIVHWSCSIVQNLLLNYHLVALSPQECHIGINISHWCVIIIAIHIRLLFAFSRAELWIIFISCYPKLLYAKKNRSIDLTSNILSKHHRNFTPKIRNAGKTGKVPEFKFNIFSNTFFLNWYKW